MVEPPVEEPPDDIDPLAITAVFLLGIVVIVAVVFGFAWLMWAGN